MYCYVSLGSNARCRYLLLRQALKLLADSPMLKLSDVSSFTHSLALNPAHPPYINAVARLEVSEGIELQSVVETLKAVEQRLLRHHGSSGIVAIDLDLVVWDGKVVREGDFNRPYFARGYNELTH